jgi:hypothetical protein
MRASRVRKRILNEFENSQRPQDIALLDGQLRMLVAGVTKADRLALFERLFGIWHHFHTPLFAVLALTVIMHVIAVELY